MREIDNNIDIKACFMKLYLCEEHRQRERERGGEGRRERERERVVDEALTTGLCTLITNYPNIMLCERERNERDEERETRERERETKETRRERREREKQEERNEKDEVRRERRLGKGDKMGIEK